MNFNKEKMAIVDLLKTKEAYEVYVADSNKNNGAYLYNVKKAFNIIKIDDSKDVKDNLNNVKDDNNFLQIAEKHFTKTVNKIKFLTIILSDGDYQKVKKDNHTIIYLNKDNYQEILHKIFSKIPASNEDKDVDIKEMSQEEILDNIQNPDSDISKKLKTLGSKLSSNNLFATWIIMSLFIGVVIMQLFLAQMIFPKMRTESLGLIFGGVSRDLLIFANQWWRLFTYVFASNNPIILIIEGMLLLLICRYAEAYLGQIKFLITILIAIPIVGLTTVVVFPQLALYGPIVLIAVLYGTLFSLNYGKATLESIVANQKTTIVGIYLLLSPLFTGYHTYIYIFTALILGVAVSFVLDYKNNGKYSSLTLLGGLIIGGFLLTAIMLLVFKKYIPAFDGQTVGALWTYKEAGLFSDEKLIDMLDNYYKLPTDLRPIYI
ncbi:hypothetical protein NPX79_03345 [Spiroplasma endosymbiont of Anurida maritima]|uniref:hypothetical protein n=1 Tax=Spiroplasma endosymbiont of Anurida maritima TaxID=2967972 RepID=UPI0036D40258